MTNPYGQQPGYGPPAGQAPYGQQLPPPQPGYGPPSGGTPAQYGQPMPYGQPPGSVPYGQATPYGQPVPYGQPGYGAPGGMPSGQDIPDYKTWAIISIVFGGVFGIIAIFKSNEVIQYKMQGNYPAAEQASRTTKTLCIIGNIVAGFACLIFLISIIVGATI